MTRDYAGEVAEVAKKYEAARDAAAATGPPDWPAPWAPAFSALLFACRHLLAAAEGPPRPPALEEWGSDCMECGNATVDSDVCDQCGSARYTRTLWCEAGSG